MRRFSQAGRLRGAQKEKRDLLVYLLWASGRMTNEQIGQLFGISYSAVSHAVKRLNAKMRIHPELTKEVEHLTNESIIL